MPLLPGLLKNTNNVKHIQTFESFEKLNEITFTDNKKVQDLLQKLKSKIKNTGVYTQVADFIRMDVIDVYSTYDNLIDHMRLAFPQFFGKGKEYSSVLEALLVEEEFLDVNEATQFQYSFSDDGLKFMDVLRSIDKDPDWSDDMTFTPDYFTEMNRTLGTKQAEALINALMKAGFVIQNKAENK